MGQTRRERTIREMENRMAAWDLLARDLGRINKTPLGLAKKHVLCELASLAVKKGFCYVSNTYLSEKWNISKQSVSGHISKLKVMGYIRVEYKSRELRHIYIDYDKINRMQGEPKSPHFIPATHKDFFTIFSDIDNFRVVPSWDMDRKLNAALKEYIRACHKEKNHVKKVDVRKQADYLIEASGGDVQKAIEIIDAAVDEGRWIC